MASQTSVPKPSETISQINLSGSIWYQTTLENESTKVFQQIKALEEKLWKEKLVFVLGGFGGFFLVVFFFVFFVLFF